MLESTLTKSGFHADVWSYLKSIEFTVEKTIGGELTKEKKEYNIERLNYLIEILSLPARKAPMFHITPSYSLHTTLPIPLIRGNDIKEALTNLQEFKQWKWKREGYESAVQRLIKTLNEYISTLKETIISPPAPVEKNLDMLTIFLSLTRKLLNDSQVHTNSLLL